MTPFVRFYMLTEDAGGHSHPTWAVLLRRMCRLIDASCDTAPAAFAVERPEKEVERTMAGNNWRSRSKLDHLQRVHFWRTIADQLDESRIVVFHVDGDVAWSRRDESENVRAVYDVARRRLEDALAHRGRTPDEIRERMTFFVPVHPFREIEAWLFHAVDLLRRLCARRRDATPACLDDWEARPGTLDEEEHPKSKLPFGAEHNLDLAKDFPAARVHALGSSFFVAVETLRACEPLRHALQRSYAPERWTVDND